ncbi:MAG: sulfate transporter CysZ [Gammaproteobacteria bacterium]|nr:sulfate transporter CysZ [Gammaproteobacteria bacterium]
MRDNPVTALFKGAGYLIEGFGLITRPRLRRFVIVPLLVNVVLFAGLLIGGGWYGGGYLVGQTQELLPGWLDWIAWLLIPILVIALLAAAFFGFALVANLIASPFNGLLAEAVENRITGARIDQKTGLLSLLKEVGIAITGELRKLIYVVPRMLLLLPLLLFVPVVGPLLWVLFGAWMLALSFADYPMGNHGHRFTQQRVILAQRRWYALGFGLATTAALTVPVLNFFVMPSAVAGATVMWVRLWPDGAAAAPPGGPASGPHSGPQSGR